MSRTDNKSIPTSISSGLAQLRARITTWLIVDGISRLLLVLVLMLIFDFVIDRIFHMDRAQRAVMLLLGLSAISYVVFRKLFQPLQATPTDDALVLEVEERNPQTKQSLISALQLSQVADIEERGYSPAMVRATIATGSEAAQETKFDNILHDAKYKRNLILAIVMGTLLFGVVVSTFASESMAIWFNRNILLGDRQWPQDVILRISGTENGSLVIPRGDDWPVEVQIDERSLRQPDEVTIDLRADGDERTFTLERASDDTFTTTLMNVDDATHIRARSGRSQTEWVPVELLDRPKVEGLQLTVIPPAYTQQSEEPLPPGFGPYYVLPGSRLKIVGTANKPLSEARVAASGWSQPLTLANATDFSLELPADKVLGTVYNVHLKDREEVYLPSEDRQGPLTSRVPTRFTLRVKPDREPHFRAKLNGVSGMVVPQAVVPLNGRVTDDFSIVDLRRIHKTLNEKGEESEEAVVSLKSIATLPSDEVNFDYAFELEDLALSPGTTLNFHIEADDNNNITGPGVGKSKTFLLRIVTEQELRSDLLRREKELRQDFERLIKSQDALLTDTKAVAAASRAEEKLAADQLELLVKIQKRQKLIGTNLANIARRFEDIAIEVRNNRIEEDPGPLQQRLKNEIVEPTWLLADDSIPDIVEDFDEVRRIKVLGDRNQKMNNLTDDQEQLIADMKDILKFMTKSEGFQEAINMLYEVQKAQEDVLKKTETERQEKIKKILEK